MSSKDKTVIVAHDAGGGEVLSAYVRAHHGEREFSVCAAGPAVASFSRRNVPFKSFEYTEIALEKTAQEFLSRNAPVSLVLTGRSAAGSPFETAFIRSARKARIPSATYFDHWVNYRESFGYPGRGWKKNLPDEFWTGDSHAFAIAQDLFSDRPIKLVPNEYFNEIIIEFKGIKRSNREKTVLFLSDIMPYGEEKVFNDLISFLDEKRFSGTLMVCFHPKETANGVTHKYDRIINLHPNIKIGKPIQGLLESIADADVVYGMEESMALVVAVLCGKKTVSVVHDPRRPFPLPYPEIIKIGRANGLESVARELFNK